MAYATARHAVLPLLFKGGVFSLTDIERITSSGSPSRED